MPTSLVAIGPDRADFAVEAVIAGGGEPTATGERADALVWLDAQNTAGLGQALDTTPGVRWVQLPFAGVELVTPTGLLGNGMLWTCAKGSYAEPVAEHALALALGGLRSFPERLAARSWGQPAGTSLYEQNVTILGGGGIARSLLALLEPFRTQVTIVRRDPTPVEGAARTVSLAQLHEALPGALVVVIALALTPQTTGVIGAAELALMDQRAWLINVARGGHVRTEELVTALRSETIAGAGLDVTEPEPLPDGHPLWELPNCILTPHTADTTAMIQPRLAARIAANVAHFIAGEELEGLVDADLGY